MALRSANPTQRARELYRGALSVGRARSRRDHRDHDRRADVVADGGDLWEGLKAGLVTFGGAFTVIPYLHGAAVDGQHWLTDYQFVDGLAMSGVLPAPLIIFSTFV